MGRNFSNKNNSVETLAHNSTYFTTKLDIKLSMDIWFVIDTYFILNTGNHFTGHKIHYKYLHTKAISDE